MEIEASLFGILGFGASQMRGLKSKRFRLSKINARFGSVNYRNFPQITWTLNSAGQIAAPSPDPIVQ